VFGHAASAAACSKLLGLSVEQIEDAIGIACTQACGLMSAQYGAMVKRMQHGFASRNGLFAALVALQGYTALKDVLEVPYGGFVSTFGYGGKDTTPERTTEGLGKKWIIMDIIVKPYASMAATHATIDCIRKIQDEHPNTLDDVDAVAEIKVEMSNPAVRKGGWVPKRPVDSTSAQMSAPYAAASQIIDHAVLAAQFSTKALDRDDVWNWVNKFICEHSQEFDSDVDMGWKQRMTVTFTDASRENIIVEVAAPKGVEPLLSNDDIVEKWKMLTGEVIGEERRDLIENVILSLEKPGEVESLVELLSKQTKKVEGF
jgi:aconitate decarboxylase